MTAWALTSRRAEESPLGDGNPRSRAMAVGEATGPDRGRASKAAAMRAAVTKTPGSLFPCLNLGKPGPDLYLDLSCPSHV